MALDVDFRNGNIQLIYVDMGGAYVFSSYVCNMYVFGKIWGCV